LSVWALCRIRRLQATSSQSSNAICFDSTWKTPGRASEARSSRLGRLLDCTPEQPVQPELGNAQQARRSGGLSRACGYGFGFNILSFVDVDGAARDLEINATGLGKYSPFIAIDDELRCSEDRPSGFSSTGCSTSRGGTETGTGTETGAQLV
jgi:hypothetical protein